MLALIIRGIFLVGVLSMYSTSVWKMIDGYFKDRFQNYLQEEFRKNPKMRDDLNSIDAAKVDNKGLQVTNGGNLLSAPPNEARQMEESLESGTKPVDVLATVASISFPLESVDVAKESGENRVKATVDNNAFQESLGMQAMRKERPKVTGSHGFQEQSAVRRKREKTKRGGGKMEKQQRDSSQDLRNKREKRLILESESNAARSRKRKFKPITFTEADFMLVKRSVKDDDFSEFNLDDEMKIIENRRAGILVSELPFKPRFDIGDLEVVTADEFCPLTLEDEATCGIPRKWP